ncbi:MAG: hypothetical protein HC940_12370, partial [Acaryochloris sp. SU_5_25]|nr:hypothetical protein [Acaryochloris sp. SU_5_25]
MQKLPLSEQVSGRNSISFCNAHNDEEAIALYKRAQSALIFILLLCNVRDLRTDNLASLDSPPFNSTPFNSTPFNSTPFNSTPFNSTLFELISDRIARAPQQRITFAEFMQRVLYEPEQGYYVTN